MAVFPSPDPWNPPNVPRVLPAVGPMEHHVWDVQEFAECSRAWERERFTKEDACLTRACACGCQVLTLAPCNSLSVSTYWSVCLFLSHSLCLRLSLSRSLSLSLSLALSLSCPVPGDDPTTVIVRIDACVRTKKSETERKSERERAREREGGRECVCASTPRGAPTVRTRS